MNPDTEIEGVIGSARYLMGVQVISQYQTVHRVNLICRKTVITQSRSGHTQIQLIRSGMQ